MNYTIAIEDDLGNITRELKEDKFHFVNLKKADLDNVDAVILNGKDENVMDMMDTITEVPVINAAGLNADQVQKELENKFEKIK